MQLLPISAGAFTTTHILKAVNEISGNTSITARKMREPRHEISEVDSRYLYPHNRERVVTTIWRRI
jgi:hypothetical protein